MYIIPCSCGKIYIGETTRRLEQRVKEHQDACKRGDEVSAIAEHAWQQHHPIKWEEVRVVDRASKNHELKIKEESSTHTVTPVSVSLAQIYCVTPESVSLANNIGFKSQLAWVTDSICLTDVTFTKTTMVW